MADELKPGGCQIRVVEVFVIVVVLGFLVLLLPMVLIQTRTPNRHLTCMNNQHQLSLAMLTYESAHGHFPGYVNAIDDGSGTPVEATWLAPVFPNLDRNDLWQAWTDGSVREKPIVYWKLLTCPSDRTANTSRGSADLSYVVNCGLPDSDQADSPEHGVFLDAIHSTDRVGLDHICERDGATYTLLLSENIQATEWAVAGSHPNYLPGGSAQAAEFRVGMVWHRTGGGCRGINACLKDTTTDADHARPSCNHGGGVVASFCDGHQQFIREDIDYSVYQHIMTPDSAAAGVPGEFDPDDL